MTELALFFVISITASKLLNPEHHNNAALVEPEAAQEEKEQNPRKDINTNFYYDREENAVIEYRDHRTGRVLEYGE